MILTIIRDFQNQKKLLFNLDLRPVKVQGIGRVVFNSKQIHNLKYGNKATLGPLFAEQIPWRDFFLKLIPKRLFKNWRLKVTCISWIYLLQGVCNFLALLYQLFNQPSFENEFLKDWTLIHFNSSELSLALPTLSHRPRFARMYMSWPKLCFNVSLQRAYYAV